MYSFITAHPFNEVQNGVTHPLFLPPPLYFLTSPSLSTFKELDPEYQVLFQPGIPVYPAARVLFEFESLHKGPYVYIC
jgi:hypothetical protein